MKKVYNIQQLLCKNGFFGRMSFKLTIGLIFFFLSYGASAQPAFDLTHTGTSGNCFATGTTYEIGIEDTHAFYYYVLFRVTLNNDYEMVYEVAAWNQNEGGGVVNFGTFGSAGKYIIIRFDDNKFNSTITGKHPLESYLKNNATLEDNTQLQNGEFWIIAQAAPRDFEFTGVEGTDYKLVGTSTTTAEFCLEGSLTVVNPEYSPDEYGDQWNVTYTLLQNGDPAVDIDGEDVPAVVNPMNDIVWDNLPSGIYTVQAERTPCAVTVFPDPPLEIIRIGQVTVTMSELTDISTLVKTPVIFDVEIIYPDLTDVHPSVLVDARIAFDKTLPPTATIIDILYNDSSVPGFDEDAIAGKDWVLLSTILNQDPAALDVHSGRTDKWTIIAAGINDADTYAVTIQSVAYTGTWESSLCKIIMAEDDFTVTFAEADIAFDPIDPVCYPKEVEAFVNAAYPIINVVDDILADGKVEFDRALNADEAVEVTLEFSYDGGATYPASATYTLTAGNTTFNLSDELPPAALNTLSGQNLKYKAVMGNNVLPGTYTVTFTGLAKLGGVEYPYAEITAGFIVVGASGVEIAEIDNIATVTGSPVVLESTITYGDLNTQNIDPSVMVDAKISFSPQLPAGTEILKLYYNGNPVTMDNPVIGEVDYVLLSNIIGTGAPTPLAGHNNLADTWKIVVDGVDVEETFDVTFQSVAYIDASVCYSVIAQEEFIVAYKNLDIDIHTVADVCLGAKVDLGFTINYPDIKNIPPTILTDAKISANLDIPADVVINWNYEGGAASGTYTLPDVLDAGDPILLSTIVGGSAPTPLLGHDGLTVNWTYELVGLGVGAYTLTVTSIAIFDGDEYDLGTTPDPVQLAFNVFPLPDPTITGPADVYSGGAYTYSVVEPDGIPGYTWSASDDTITFDNINSRTPTITFTWPLTGTVTITAVVSNGTCSASYDFPVEVHPNLLVGQVKYYNINEDPMPSPFMTNFDGMPIPDFFYVALLSHTFSFEGTENPRASAIEWVKVDEIYWGEGDEMDDYTVLEAAFEFEYNLNPAIDYKIAVWDGGYFEEMQNGDWDYEHDSDKGILGKSWTWNNWGGVNATDALLIQHMVVGTDMSGWPNMKHVGLNTDLPKYGAFAYDVADVNDSKTLTALDALLTSRRGIGLLQKFPGNKPNFSVAGIFVDINDFNTNNIFNNQIPTLFEYPGLPNYNWSTLAVNHYYGQKLSEIKNREVLGNSYLNIYYNATGDINSSYTPDYGGFKNSNVMLYHTGEKYVNVGSVIDVPISLTRFANVGAFSLGIDYRNDLIEILSTNFGEDFAYFDNENGMLRIAWESLQGMNLDEGEEIVVITLRVLTDIEEGTKLFEITNFTEIADINAKMIEGVDLQTVELKTDALSVFDTAANELNAINYPNPFSNTTTIRYELPENGQVLLVVYNKMGQIVKTPVDKTQVAGTYEVTINGSDLQGHGVYYYKLEVRGSDKHYSVTNSMILLK